MIILIVDDSVSVRRMIKEIISDSASEIHECNDGLSAVELYKKIHPDVVLMDIKMKHMNGINATKMIIQIDSKAKVIIVSNYDDEFIREEAKKVGEIKYFTKVEIYKLPEYIKTISRN
ncbi:MAG: response regulator [Bacteroidota bacterium]|nr:response regulator [Bacteroidota bacterium]